MKRIIFLSLAVITGFCLRTPPLFAQDQDPVIRDTKTAEAPTHPAGRPSHNTKEVSKANVQRPVQQGATQQAAAPPSTAPTAQNNGAYAQGNQQTDRSQSQQQQSQGYASEGNRANHYNGRWFPPETHGDWDRQANHRWNNHEYQWYDGGWLIIDTGYSPGYVVSPSSDAAPDDSDTTADSDVTPDSGAAPASTGMVSDSAPAPDNAASGSVGTQVQGRLAQQGYYDGPIDGQIGPRTRLAITKYQSDYGLQVNGQIDEPLLVSLGLE